MANQSAARFVGRDVEIELLRGELSAALAGDGQLVFLVGDPGMGKTRTATALAADARERGAGVAWGRCHEGEGAPIYWPWLQALGACAEAAGEPAGSELASLLPSLRAPHEHHDAGLPEQARFELSQRVVSGLAAAARARPQVVILDDLHWADVGSLRLLEFLGRELGSLPLLVLGTLRGEAARLEGESSERLAAALRLGRSVPLTGLDRPAVASLLADRLGRAPAGAVLDQVVRSTDGNPFFVIEMAHLLGTDASGAAGRARPALPPGARELLRRRLAPLSAEALRLLRAAAVMGREFELGPLGRVLDLPVDAVLDKLGAPLAHGLVREVPGTLRRYSFTHALMRESLYESLAPGERAALHHAIAAGLEQGLGADDDQRLPALAHHYFEAAQLADPAKAVRYGCEAGERAAHLLAFEEAVRHFERALAAAELGADDAARARTLLGLADALHASGDRARSDKVFAEALEVARRVAGATFADAALRYAVARPEFGVLDVATNALLEEALVALPREPSALRARLLARLAAGSNLQPGSELRRRQLSDEAVRIARGLDDAGTLGFVLSRRLIGLLGPDHLAERIATTDEILRAGSRSRAGELEALLVRVDDLAERADRVALDHALTVFEQKATASRQPFFAWSASSCRTAMALLEGRYAEAETLAQQTLALGQRAQTPRTALLNFGQQLFTLRGWQNRLAEVAPLIETGVAETAVVPAWRCGLATFYTLSGRDVEARRELEALASHDFSDLPRDTTWLSAVALLSRVCARLQDARRAARLYELMLPFAGRIAGARPLVVLVSTIDERLGALAAQLGRFDAAEAHFRQALALAERMRALPWQADIRHEWARMLRERSRRGDRERAQQLLDEAEAIAEPIGMALLLGWIEECRASWRLGAARAVGVQEPRRLGFEPRRGNVVTLLPRAAPTAAPLEPAGTFRREGDVWTLVFEGRTTRVRHMLGLGHLARLLRQPEREVHAGELVAAAYEGQRADAGGEAAVGDAGAQLDAKARASYEARLREARAELEDAEQRHDLGRGERLGEEVEFLLAELSRGFGLGGRERRAASASERARLSVTRAIKYAIDRIAEHDAALADHLRRAVRTGTFCVYAPSARDRVSWGF